jgi:hypothetical protein
MTNFLSEENTKLMWDIITEQDSYMKLTAEEKIQINNLYKTNILVYYQQQMNKGITGLQELDKQYIRFIIDKIQDYDIDLEICEFPIHQEKEKDTPKQEDMDKLLHDMVLERNYHTRPIQTNPNQSQSHHFSATDTPRKDVNTDNYFIPISIPIPIKEDTSENTSFLNKLKKIDKPISKDTDRKIAELEKEVSELKRILYELQGRYV